MQICRIRNRSIFMCLEYHHIKKLFCFSLPSSHKHVLCLISFNQPNQIHNYFVYFIVLTLRIKKVLYICFGSSFKDCFFFLPILGRTKKKVTCKLWRTWVVLSLDWLPRSKQGREMKKLSPLYVYFRNKYYLTDCI